MAAAEDEGEDLESYWKLLRPASLIIRPASGRVSNLREGLELAALKAEQTLLRELETDPGKLTFMPMADIVGLCIKTLLDGWYNGIASHGSGSLLEIVLEDQRLPTAELKDFVRALPQSLIVRILESAPMNRASGIHALLAVEAHFRSTGDRDYSIRRDANSVLIVTLKQTDTAEAVTFRLDENFKLDS